MLIWVDDEGLERSRSSLASDCEEACAVRESVHGSERWWRRVPDTKRTWGGTDGVKGQQQDAVFMCAIRGMNSARKAESRTGDRNGSRLEPCRVAVFVSSRPAMHTSSVSA